MSSPMMNRRAAIVGALVSSAALAVPVAVSASSAEALRPTSHDVADVADVATPENPALVALGKQFWKEAQRLARAERAYWKAYHKAMKAWPTAPEIITYKATFYGGRDGQMERDIRGCGMLADKTFPTYDKNLRASGHPRALWISGDARSSLAHREQMLRRKRKRPMPDAERAELLAEIANLDAIAVAAEGFEKTRDDIRKAVRWKEVDGARKAALAAVMGAATALMAEHADTLEGVCIKAGAIAEWHRYPDAIWDQYRFHHARDLAEDVLRLAHLPT